MTFTMEGKTLQRKQPLTTRKKRPARSGVHASDYPYAFARVNCLDSTSNASGSPLLSVGPPELFAQGVYDEWTVHRNFLFRYSGGWQMVGGPGAFVFGLAPGATTAGQQGWWTYNNGWVWIGFDASWTTNVAAGYYYAVAQEAWWYRNGQWSDHVYNWANHFHGDQGGNMSWCYVS